MHDEDKNDGPTYLRLIEEQWVHRALQSLPGLEQLSGRPLRTQHKLQSADIQPNTAFAISAIADDAGIGGLAGESGVQAINWPPLMVLSKRALAGWEQENLRRQGVNALLSTSTLPRARRVVEALARSAEWFGANLTRAPLADLLQMLAADGRSGMIWVGCAHNPPLSAQRWDSGGAFCAGNSGACNGWAARLHLNAGRLVYAETPTLLGLEAFSRCLALKEGYLRVHEVFMAPRRGNLDGTVQQLLIRAAALADEEGRRTGSSRRPAAGPISPPDSGRRGPSAPPSTPAQRARSAPDPYLTADLAPATTPMGDSSAVLPVPSEVPSTRPVSNLAVRAQGSVPPPLPRSAAPRASSSGRRKSHPPPVPNEYDDMLGGPAQVQLVVQTDDSSGLISVHGEGDAENAAAVATLCRTALDSVGQQLQLGRVQSWCLLGQAYALYTHHRGSKSRLALGAASDNAFRFLGDLLKEDDA